MRTGARNTVQTPFTSSKQRRLAGFYYDGKLCLLQCWGPLAEAKSTPPLIIIRHCQNGDMIPRFQSSGRFSECQTSLMMCVSHRMILSPPALSISDVILQMPGTGLFFSSCTALFTSSTVTGSVEQSRDGSAVCEEASRSRSRLAGGWWSNLLKCSIHRETQPRSLLMIWPFLSFTREILKSV